MIKKLFTTDLYVKVSKNKLVAKNLSTNSSWQSITPEKPFTTDRLLVGTFSAAEPTLAQLVKKLLPKGLLKKSPQILIHPVDMVEGGLSEVESRVFRELAFGAGACRVVLYVGSELSDSEAVKLIGSA
ncbi:MAG: 1-pyrroline-5-carboxylate dehydrogenase [Gammaproteobacteria bacterium]|nr:1-pyrroline-5-carboxylate dehydrogenase [Gammaproteobacteria bacterium]